MIGDPVRFDAAFKSLFPGREPFGWQRRLFDHFATRQIPLLCTLPTGMGKTSVIPIWLIALAHSANARGGQSEPPRRLVYIVNRRTVVDQATDDAKRLLGRIYRSGQREHLPWATEEALARLGLSHEPLMSDEHAPSVAALRRSLASLSGDDSAAPLAVSTLRGELADNGEWKRNPARAAIIIGTIDMIGSKLLFSGYGDGRYGRAHHAGLIGQDALIVHDEAHLSPAFDALLHTLAKEQVRGKEARQVRVMSLSATPRANGSDPSNGNGLTADYFGIVPEDDKDAIVNQRRSAPKCLRTVAIGAGKDVLAKELANAALEQGKTPARVLIYVRSPEAAVKVAGAIEKELGDGGSARVARLTGTIRGFERDGLASGRVLSAFKAAPNRPPLEQSLYLVSTSAGEVGADFDADHLVCDLTTLDSMAQRFGRVNRLGGEGRSAQVVVVTETSAAGDADSSSPAADGGDEEAARDGKQKPRNAYETARLKTRKILEKQVADHGGDVSLAALAAVLASPEAQAAVTPEPTILPATDILFDVWAVTSIAGEMPSRPEVEPYLHGVADWEPPETHVAWRADIARLSRANGENDEGQPLPCAAGDLDEVFDVFPLRSIERLRDRTDRVQDQLRAMAERLSGAEQRPEQSQAGDAEPAAQGESEADADEPIPPRALPHDPWLVLQRAGSAHWVRLSELAPDPKDKNAVRETRRRMAFATIVLPVEVGGFKNGMLDGSEPPPTPARELDVSEKPIGDVHDRQRVLVVDDEGRESPLMGGAIADQSVRFIARHSVTFLGGEDERSSGAIEYRVARGEDREPGERVGLAAHNGAVASCAERMARALGLDDASVEAIRLAGCWHDAGKARAIWQRYANNQPNRSNPGGPIAKSDRYGRWQQLGGYRHEFGSILDATQDAEVQGLDEPTRDLMLHLIAAHHGWARPHFEPRHFDRERPTRENETAAVEAIQRFARLQQRYGRWGLAWFESILRCADAEASHAAASAADDGAGKAHAARDDAAGGAA